MSYRLVLVPLAALLLAACTVGPDFVRPDPAVPARWSAPLPHGGESVALREWWRQFDDPRLDALIAAAEADSPTLDLAVARMAEARANAGVSEAALSPTLTGSASATRSRTAFGPQVFQSNVFKAGFDAGWELDLFGGNRRALEAARARQKAAGVDWHDARVSLAGDVADAYVALRACEAGSSVQERNLASRIQTRELTALKASAGFTPKAEAARAEGAVAEAASTVVAKRGECAQHLNALAKLTGWSRDRLVEHLAGATAVVPVPRDVSVEAVPARAITQRPDVASAELAVAAASAEIGVAEADRYPGVSLTGAIALNRISLGQGATRPTTWSIGPSVSLPIFDAGRRKAAAVAARARRDQALATWREKVRVAVREVEDALVRLDTAAARAADAQRALDRYDAYAATAETRYRGGLASLLELEDARRLALQASEAELVVRRERVAAWIALYKALGGGWQDPPETLAAR
jgi:outer membrane protein, multidrug efflux system